MVNQITNLHTSASSSVWRACQVSSLPLKSAMPLLLTSAASRWAAWALLSACSAACDDHLKNDKTLRVRFSCITMSATHAPRVAQNFWLMQYFP